jgi:hypothetical protein
MNLKLVAVVSEATRFVGPGKVGRVAALLGIASAYIAMHWLMTIAEVLHEQHRFDDAPIFATKMITDLERLHSAAGRPDTPLSSTERSSVDDIERIWGWFLNGDPVLDLRHRRSFLRRFCP